MILTRKKANFKNFKTMLKRGAFLVFEGVDRCGKTTQTKLLVEKLKQDGRKVELMRFPGKFSFLLRIVRLSVSKRKT